MGDWKRGLFDGVPDSVYHSREIGVVSKGALDRLARSPAHYRAWLDAPPRDTDAVMFGRAFHCATLEPERFEQIYTVEPDFGDCRKTDNRNARNEWRAANTGKRLVDAADFDALRFMGDAIRKHPLAGKMLRDGRPESSVFWEDPHTGLKCRCRPDYYVPDRRMTIDIKSADDASRNGFRRAISKYRYHVQDALYREGLAAVGERVEYFLFVAVEKEPPWAVAIFSLDEQAVERGYAAARDGMTTMARCLREGQWPAYETGIQVLDLPAWAA